MENVTLDLKEKSSSCYLQRTVQYSITIEKYKVKSKSWKIYIYLLNLSYIYNFVKYEMGFSHIAYPGKAFERYIKHVECKLEGFNHSLNDQLNHFLQLHRSGIPRYIISRNKKMIFNNIILIYDVFLVQNTLTSRDLIQMTYSWNKRWNTI